jgi:outer membrane protein insertion porin family
MIMLKQSSIAMLLLCIFAAPLSAASPTRIASIQVEGLRHISQERVLGLFPCKVGDTYTPVCVDTAKRYLNEWRVFDSIHFDIQPASDGVHITLTVKEALLVGAVDITGNYPFLSLGLQRRLTLRPGHTFTEADAQKQIDRISTIYLKSGYVDTTADLSTTYSPEQNDILVNYDIRKGKRVKLGTLTVAGNHALPYGRFLSVFNPYKTYTTAHRRDAVNTLIDLYRRKGYLRARIKVTSEHYDPISSKTDVTVTVTEGPQVDIRYVGNRGISTARLRKAITLVKDGSYDEIALEDSNTALTALYNRNGYGDVQVTSSKEEVSSQKVVVTFTITEGRRSVVDHVNFLGNTAVSGGKLRKQILTKPISLFSRGNYDPIKLRYDRQVLLNYYKSIGFEGIQIPEPNIISIPNHRNQIDVNFEISEGDQIKVSDVILNGISDSDAKKIREQLINRTGQPYNALAGDADSEIVTTWLKDNGHPYATLTRSTSHITEGNGVVIRYDIVSGHVVKIGEVLLVGNTLTSQRAVREKLYVKTGDTYSAHKILESEFALRRLGVFQNVRIEQMGLDEKSDSIHLAVRMEELRPLVVDVSAGFATDDLYTGSFTFTNFNTFGWAKRLSLRFIGGQRLSRGEITWVDPSFFNHDLQWSVNGLVQFVRLPYFSYVQPSVGTGFFRRFHRTSYLARYQLDKNYFMNGNPVRAATAGIRNSTLSKISFATTYDTRNSFADPTKGYYLLGAVDVVNEIKGEEANFFKFRAGVGVYTGFWKIFALLNDVRFNRIETIGSNINVPGNERFFLGGDSTIRGFPLDSIGPKDISGDAVGANMSWVHNIELRIKATPTFQIAVWHDMGSLTDTFSQISTTTFKESIGPGIRIMTPVGPIKLDWSYVLPPKQGSDPDQRFHFSFGNVF